MIHWLTTSPDPHSRRTGYDAGQRGWRLHAVEGPAGATFADVGREPAACGLRPAHGWGLDLYIDEPCKRCVASVGATPDTLLGETRREVVWQTWEVQ